MKKILSGVEWKKYSVGLAFLLVSIILCAIAIFYYYSMSEEHRLSGQRLSQHVSQLQYSQEKMNLYQEILPEFSRYQERGLIGNNKRLQWLETAQRVGEKYDVPQMQYLLQNARATQQNYDHYWNSMIRLDIARMELRMTLVHEGDWFSVINHMRDFALGLFSIEKCRLKLFDEKDGDILEGMTSECLLDWYTLDDITATWEGQ